MQPVAPCVPLPHPFPRCTCIPVSLPQRKRNNRFFCHHRVLLGGGCCGIKYRDHHRVPRIKEVFFELLQPKEMVVRGKAVSVTPEVVECWIIGKALDTDCGYTCKVGKDGRANFDGCFWLGHAI
jgi:hypothetical protein